MKAYHSADDDWVACAERMPDEGVIVELAVVDGGGQPYRAFGCRYDGGDGWTWALATYGIPDDPHDCEADDDYDVFAWREPTPLPAVPAVRRFKITRDRGEDEAEVVAIVDGRDEAQRIMNEIGLAARWTELPPAAEATKAEETP